MKNKPKQDKQSASKERADQETAEESMGALDKLAGGQPDPPEKVGGEAEDVLNDEELDALEELVEKVQASHVGVSDSSEEELLALEELLGVENSSAEDAGSLAADLSSMDEELAALEELVEVTPAKKEQSPAGNRAVSEEVRALDALTDTAALRGDGPLQQEATPDADDEGVITLKEVVSLGQVTERGLASQAKKKQRTSAPGPAVRQKKSSASVKSGLSAEEQDDLETLIKGFRDEASSGVTAAMVGDLQTQIHALQKRVMSLSKMMAKMEGKIAAFGEVLRLQHKKTELVNRRIDRIASYGQEE